MKEQDESKPELNVLYCHNCQHFFDSINDAKQKTITIDKETDSL